LKERKIRVNVLSPGPIDTPGHDPFGPEAKEMFASTVPRGSLGRPEEIATAAIFLASSDSSFVNGVELFVDGGTAQI
jgi:NAD(P)-dependent dehydrogenase (short-subunit alcohol dehydrogenase family)